MAAALPERFALDQQAGRADLWRLARLYGPALAGRVAKRTSAIDSEVLSRIAAVGLAGGPTARDILARAQRSRDEAEVVLTCLAGPRSLASASFRQLAEDSRRKEVERFAAWVAFLVADKVPAAAVDKFRSKERRFGELGAILAAIRHPTLPVPELPEKLERRAARGSLADFEFRATLLLAIARPGSVERDELEDVVHRGARPDDLALAALALARLEGKASTSDAADLLKRLKKLAPAARAPFVLGLPRVEPALLEELGTPGATLNPAQRALHWAVVAKSVEAKDHATLMAALVDAEHVAEAAFQVLARRLLLEPGFELRVDQALKESLLDGEPRRWRCFVGLLVGEAQLDTKRRAVLGSRCAAALALHREGRLGRDAKDGRRLLMKHALAGEWLRVDAASADAVVVRELNELVRDVFLAGSDLGKTRGLLGELPRGIRAVETEYFQVLDQFLSLYPPFREQRSR